MAVPRGGDGAPERNGRQGEAGDDEADYEVTEEVEVEVDGNHGDANHDPDPEDGDPGPNRSAGGGAVEAVDPNVIADDLTALLQRYPVDDRARDYFESSPLSVISNVIRDFRPPREGEPDYSGLLTTFVKRVRQQHGFSGHPGARAAGAAALQGGHSVRPSGGLGHHGTAPSGHRPHGAGKGGHAAARSIRVVPAPQQRSTGPQRALQHALAVEGFCNRYPIDETAYEYFSSSPMEVQIRVLEEFQPAREGEADYSALIMRFVKKVRLESSQPAANSAGTGPPPPAGPAHSQASRRPSAHAQPPQHPPTGVQPSAAPAPWNTNRQDWRKAPTPAVPSLERLAEEFEMRYPIDDRARDYFSCSSPDVQQKVLREFKPIQEGEADYSSLFMAFVKRCRRESSQPQDQYQPGPPAATYGGCGGGGGGRSHGGPAGFSGSRASSQGASSRREQDQFEAFLARYPMDDRAIDYLASSPREVRERVLSTFVAPRPDERDFSAPVTAYTKACHRHFGYGNGKGSDRSMAALEMRGHPGSGDGGHNGSRGPPPRDPYRGGDPHRDREGPRGAEPRYSEESYHRSGESRHRGGDGHRGGDSYHRGGDSRGRVHPRHEGDDLLHRFFQQYPVDERAIDFLTSSPPMVIERVIREFRPKREGDSDYSQIVMAFTKRCRDQEVGGGVEQPAWKRPRGR